MRKLSCVVLASLLFDWTYTLSSVPDADFTQSPATNGLTGEQRKRYHLMDEGIHYLPDRMLRALRRPKVPLCQASLVLGGGLYDEPFLSHPQRLGLVSTFDDAGKNYVVGLSLSKDPGSEPMVGLNCATCHTAALRVKQPDGKTVQVLVDGGPSNFSINRFVEEMTLSLVQTLMQDFPRFYERYRGVPMSRAEQKRIEKLQRKFLKTLQDLTAETDAEPAKKQEQIAADGMATRAVQVPGRKAQLKQRADKENIATEPLELRVELLASLAEVQPDDSDLPEGLENAFPRPDALETPEEVWNYMAARFTHFYELTKNVVSGTPAGLGRSDPWSTTRTLMASKLPGGVDAKPPPAPVGNAQLWSYESYKWQFLSGVTNSMLERNLAQGVALLADYDWTQHATSVSTRKLNDIAELARTITPPKWPSEFPPVDAALAAEGKVLFKANCLTCHQPARRDSYEARPYWDVGTDRAYTKNQRVPFGTEPLFTRLESWMKEVKARAYARENVTDAEAKTIEKGRLPSEWQTRRGEIRGQVAGRNLGVCRVPAEQLGANAGAAAPRRERARGVVRGRHADR